MILHASSRDPRSGCITSRPDRRGQALEARLGASALGRRPSAGGGTSRGQPSRAQITAEQRTTGRRPAGRAASSLAPEYLTGDQHGLKTLVPAADHRAQPYSGRLVTLVTSQCQE